MFVKNLIYKCKMKLNKWKLKSQSSQKRSKQGWMEAKEKKNLLFFALFSDFSDCFLSVWAGQVLCLWGKQENSLTKNGGRYKRVCGQEHQQQTNGQRNRGTQTQQRREGATLVHFMWPPHTHWTGSFSDDCLLFAAASLPLAHQSSFRTAWSVQNLSWKVFHDSWHFTRRKESCSCFTLYVCACRFGSNISPPPPSQIPVSVQNRSTLCWFIMKDLSKGVGASYLGSKRWGRWCWWCCSSVWRRTETTQLHTNTSFRNNLHWTGARPPNGQGGASEITDAHLSRTAKNCRKLRYGEEKL